MSVPPIGRGAELSTLRGWVAGLRSGAGRAVLVEGEPGIGKTTVVRSALADVPTHWGAGDELGQALPLLPLLEGMRVRTGADPRRRAITALLRGETPVGTLDPVTAASEQLIALVDETCSTGPTVIVVDDLHWADQATVALWCRLARSAHDLPLLLIGITRHVPRGPSLLALRRVATDVMRVRRLDEPAVVDLVRRVAGGEPGSGLLALAAGAAGNPLYLTELVDALRRTHAVERVGDAVEVTGVPAPGSLGAAIAHRLDGLSERVRTALRAAALLGVKFDVAEVGAVLGERIPVLVEVMAEALAAGVLERGAAGDRLAFRHPLIRGALYDDMPDTVRAAWHRDAARALADAGAPVHRVARQYRRAAELSDQVDGWLTGWLTAAAPELIAQAPAVAVDLLGRAVAAGETSLVARLAEAHHRRGDAAAAERVACAALEGGVAPDVMVDLQWTLAQARVLTGHSDRSLVTLAEALATPGLEPRHVARLLVLTARAHRNLGEVDVAGATAKKALAAAEDAGDAWAVGWSLHVLIIVSVMSGEVEAALPLFDRALAVTAADPALADLRLLLQVNLAVTLGDLDRYDDAIAAAQEVRGLAESTGNLVRLAQSCSALAELLQDVGRWDDAIAEVAAVAAEHKDPAVACCDHGVAAVIHLHRGDPDRAATHLRAAEPHAERIGTRVIASHALARALDREHAGAPTEALAVLRGCLSGDAEEIEEMEDLLPEAARLAVLVGDRGAAGYVTGLAEKLAQGGAPIPHRVGGALLCRGLLDDDPETLMSAAEHFVDRPLPRARATHAAALAYARRGDKAAARSAFTEADDVYTELGARWDSALLRSDLRAHGIRRGPRSRHAQAVNGWAALTPTENRVAELVAEGLSNPQIANRLVLSKRTVGTHVSHILAKLGVASRTDIAREAAHRYRDSG